MSEAMVSASVRASFGATKRLFLSPAKRVSSSAVRYRFATVSPSIVHVLGLGSTASTLSISQPFTCVVCVEVEQSIFCSTFYSTVEAANLISVSPAVTPPVSATETAGYTSFEEAGFTTSEHVGAYVASKHPLYGIPLFSSSGERSFTSIAAYHPVMSGALKQRSSTLAAVVVSPNYSTCVTNRSIATSTSAIGITSRYYNVAGVKFAFSIRGEVLHAPVTGFKPVHGNYGEWVITIEGVPVLDSRAVRAPGFGIKLRHANRSLYSSSSLGVRQNATGTRLWHSNAGVRALQSFSEQLLTCAGAPVNVGTLKQSISSVVRPMHVSALTYALASGSRFSPNTMSVMAGLLCYSTASFPQIEEKLIVTVELELDPALRARLKNLMSPKYVNALIEDAEGILSIHATRNVTSIKGDNADSALLELKKLLNDLDVDVEKEYEWWESV